jgi:hypothetical protein
MKEASSSDLPEAQAPRTGGFATLMPEGVDYAIQVAHEMDLQFRSRGVPLRLEPEHGPVTRRNTDRHPTGGTS